MKRIPADVRMDVEERAPRFVSELRRVAELRHASRSHLAELELMTLRLNLAAFRGDFALLYQCLWYADSKSVPILFTANGGRRLK